MATPRAELPLRGCRVLVCRPQPEADRLVAAFHAAGAEARALPLLERLPLPDTAATRTAIQNLDQFHHVIAVSPYAARQLLALIDTWWPQLPLGLHWYGVGQGTARVLQQAGLQPHWPSTGVDSEALLALPELARLSGQKVLLARGENGRELLRDTLQQRGAQVTPLALYRRQCPADAGQRLDTLLRDFDPHAVVLLSGETLNNFIALGENSDHTLYQRLLVVPVQRVADQAARAGFHNLCIPPELSDHQVIAAVAQHLAPTAPDTDIPAR